MLTKAMTLLVAATIAAHIARRGIERNDKPGRHRRVIERMNGWPRQAAYSLRAPHPCA